MPWLPNEGLMQVSDRHRQGLSNDIDSQNAAVPSGAKEPARHLLAAQLQMAKGHNATSGADLNAQTDRQHSAGQHNA